MLRSTLEILAALGFTSQVGEGAGRSERIDLAVMRTLTR
jgi:hypothetical protein